MQIGASKLRAILQCHHGVLQPSLHQIGVELALVLQIDLGLAAFGAEQGWLGNVEKAGLNQRAHMPEEECQQQGPDMAAINIGIGHDDDLVIARLFDVHFIIANTTTDGGDQRADFGR